MNGTEYDEWWWYMLKVGMLSRCSEVPLLHKMPNEIRRWNEMAAPPGTGRHRTQVGVVSFNGALEEQCTVQEFYSPWWPLRFESPWNNGGSGGWHSFTCGATYMLLTCSIGGDLGEVCSFQIDNWIPLWKNNQKTIFKRDWSHSAVLERSQQPFSLALKALHHLDLSIRWLHVPPPFTYVSLLVSFRAPSGSPLYLCLSHSLCLQWQLFHLL